MLICRFSGPNGPDQLMAPVARIRFVQGAIYANEEQKPAAMYSGDRWTFRGHGYTRVTVEGPLIATLHDTENGTSLHSASYRKVWFADGALHAPSGVVAVLDTGTRLWRDAACERYAHELRLELRTQKTHSRLGALDAAARR